MLTGSPGSVAALCQISDFVCWAGKAVFLLKAKGCYLGAVFQSLFGTEVSRGAEQKKAESCS